MANVENVACGPNVNIDFVNIARGEQGRLGVVVSPFYMGGREREKKPA